MLFVHMGACLQGGVMYFIVGYICFIVEYKALDLFCPFFLSIFYEDLNFRMCIKSVD